MEALAVRPNGGDRIRNWLHVLLREQGVAVKTLPDLVDGTPETNIVQALRVMRGDFLLMPFLAGRSSAGRPTDGLTFLERIRREVPWARRTPVIMHVSIFALTAFSTAYEGRAVENLFVLFEDELASESTPGKLGVWLRANAPQFRHFAATA